MDIQVVTKNLKIGKETRDYAVNKLGRLEKYLSAIKAVKLDLVEEKSKSRMRMYRAQATINIDGFIIRGEQTENDLRAAIDRVLDVTERLVKKYKKRFPSSRGRVTASIRKPVAEMAAQALGREAVQVVKNKRFAVKPMTVNEAIDQMEFIGHNFFIFVNIEDNSIGVVYRRKDGNYGLIQPVID